MLLSFFSIGYAAAQSSSVLSPYDNRFDHDLGLMFALGQNYQTGKMNVDCEECQFESGTMFGWTLGLYYDRTISSWFRVGAMASLDGLSIESGFSEIEKGDVQSAINGLKYSVPLKFTHDAELSVLSFSIAPYMMLTPTKWLFVKVGPDFGIPLQADIKHTKTLETKKVTLPTGEIALAYIEGTKSYSKVVQDGEYPDVLAPQIGLFTSVGANIELNPRIFMTPQFIYRTSFSDFSDFGEGFSINSWRLGLGISMAF